MVSRKKRHKQASWSPGGVLLCAGLATLLLCLSAQEVLCAEVTLAWSENENEPDLAGYRVFWRELGEAYDYSARFKEVESTTCRVPDLKLSVMYYFVVRAFDLNQNESENSDDVGWIGVGETQSVTLQGSGAYDSLGEIASYEWVHSGTSLDLFGTTSSTLSFVAPSVDSNGETLEFTLTVTDKNGLIATDLVFVHIYNDPLVRLEIRGIGDSPPETIIEETTTACYEAWAEFENEQGDTYRQEATQSSSWQIDSPFASLKYNNNLGCMELSATEVVVGQEALFTADYTFNIVSRSAELDIDIIDISDGDSDGDGMPDWWEIEYGLNPYNSNDAGTDLDGDGLDNLD